MATPLASLQFTPGNLDAAITFLKRTRGELRNLRKVRLWKDRFHVIDINQDYFEILGVGYVDAAVVPLLQMINAAYNPATLHEATDQEYKEYDTGRRHRWAEDRVM
jgi:hypothetical protein